MEPQINYYAIIGKQQVQIELLKVQLNDALNQIKHLTEDKQDAPESN